jgi:acetyl-CoA carboxylase, biotin carboxylase subunit
MIRSLLVANRGEIARRVIRTARRLGIQTVAVHTDVDATLPFVREADEAVPIGPAGAYRDIDAILAAAKSTGAEAVHPGYGFLAENADFARTVTSAGLVWVGPGADAIAAMGNKVNARNVMAAAGVPVAPGTTDPAADASAAAAAAEAIGYPVMVKAAAGGGGMGMAVAADEAALRTEYEKVRAFAVRMFGDGSVLIERYFPRVRHVEVQILGLADGRVVALGERECSVQRRNQKVAEESPSPAVAPSLRASLLAAGVRAGEAVGYRNAGTVEFLFDPGGGDVGGGAPRGEFFFLEMNTRLQVEHPVTEMVYGVDLVEEQLRVASGLAPTFGASVPAPSGHAIELRINAEDPKRFLPGPGTITRWVEPSGEGVRVDSGYAVGDTVTPSYDSLLAKLIVYGPDRGAALARAREAVAGFEVAGPKCNLPFFTELLANPDFVAGDYDTGIVGRMR